MLRFSYVEPSLHSHPMIYITRSIVNDSYVGFKLPC